MAGNSPHRLFRFGIFEVNLAERQLRKRGRKVKLEAQPFQVLVALLQRPGELVTREELRQEIWPADTFVDFDHGLNTAVKKIRDALGDSAQNPRCIETAPRQGYRFIAAVDAGDVQVTPESRMRRWKWIAVTAVTTAVALAWLFGRSGRVGDPILAPVPLTSYPGVEECASFSPDGNRVVFGWQDAELTYADIYVKQIGADKPFRLTDDPALEFSPAWSPDGKWIAFLRERAEGRTAVMLKPPVGGAERVLTETFKPAWTASVGPYIAWSPDGKSLAIMDKDAKDEPFALYLLSLETLERRRLTKPPPHTQGDYCPSFSWDGRRVAFSRTVDFYTNDLYLLRLNGDLEPRGEPERLTFLNRWARTPVWTPDRREIIFSGSAQFGVGLWKIDPRQPGKPSRLATPGGHYLYPAISRQGHLAYTQLFIDADIWRHDLRANIGQAEQSTRLIDSTYRDLWPSYSPDGSRIAFASNRTGKMEVWVCDREGFNLRQVSRLGAFSWPTSWSRDGNRIGFTSNVEGNNELYCVSPEGGPPNRLTNHPADDSQPTWSRDGTWIYFVSDRSGRPEIWRIPVSGDGKPWQLTRNGAEFGLESPDGKFLCFSRTEAGGTSIWRIPVEGGKETRVIVPDPYAGRFTVAEEGIYYLSRSKGGAAQQIQLRRWESAESEEVSEVEGWMSWGLSASSNGRHLLFVKGERLEGDLMLVENFR